MANKLYLAFDKIPEKEPLKDNSILTSYNWSKILYYNELAICYSGLNQSSMSLGYAEQSIWLLEKLYPKMKNFENESLEELENMKKKIENDENPLSFSQIVRLYTFALYNRGEAQRLLHNEELALKTFQRVIEIDKMLEKVPFDKRFGYSDYIASSLRKGIMLVDMGRGYEAIKVFDTIIKEISEDDYRFWDARFERSRALLDQKKYELALNSLDWIEKNQERDTFIFRKTEISSVLLLNEFKKNKPKDFEDKTALAKGIEKKANAVINFPKAILKKTVERQDGDNFKRACLYLANYFLVMAKEKSDTKTNEDKALKYFYLYLFYKKFEDQKTKRISKNINFIIDEWTREDNDIWTLLLEKYRSEHHYFLEVLDKVEEETYLKDFFNLYIIISERRDRNLACDEDDKEIVTKLKKRLVHIYSQKENKISLEQIDDKYNHYEGICSKRTDRQRRNSATRFIEKYFFKVNTKKNLDIESYLLHNSIVQKMERNTNNFISKVVGNSKFPGVHDEKLIGRLNVLRRWNSFTPTLRSPVNQSKGGGYFLYIASEDKSSDISEDKSLGIVIDPGYNFLENFFSQGFRIGDIDIVLVSHAHPDHTDNLPSILSLFHEMNGRLGKFRDEKKRNKKSLTLVLSPGVFEHYSHIIKPSEEHLKDIIVMDMNGGDIETAYYSDNFSENYTVEIKAFGTSHKDLSSSESQSLGFKIIVDNKLNKKSIIGYTSDARWKSQPQNWATHFYDCTIICAHLGSIVNILENKDFCNTFCEKSNKCENNEYFKNKCKKSGFNQVDVVVNKLEKQTQEENHLYLGGLTSFFNAIFSRKEKNLQLAIISEFGEELKDGLRIDLSRKLNCWFSERFRGSAIELPKCLPGDIGLEIDIFTGRVLCHCCERFVDRDKIDPIPYGREEAIYFICKECKSVLSSYQIGENLKDYYENGRKLELADES